MKAWITELTLQTGQIIEADDLQIVDTGPYAAVYVANGETKRLALIRPGEWHLTKKAAITHVKRSRAQKIKSLEKQIERLRSLKFE